MVRRGVLLGAAGLLLAGLGKSDAFYLPGKAPNSYSEGDKVGAPKDVHVLQR